MVLVLSVLWKQNSWRHCDRKVPTRNSFVAKLFIKPLYLSCIDNGFWALFVLFTFRDKSNIVIPQQSSLVEAAPPSNYLTGGRGKVDSEYQSFMAELTGKPAPSPSAGPPPPASSSGTSIAPPASLVSVLPAYAFLLCFPCPHFWVYFSYLTVVLFADLGIAATSVFRLFTDTSSTS